MLVLYLWLAGTIAQADICSTGEAARALEVASQRGAAFDTPGAADAYGAAADAGCASAAVAARYLRALSTARTAYALGGSPASLVPVRETIAVLEASAAGAPGPAQVASFVLQAAAAAAQSERDQMTVLLEHAVRLERIQLEAQQPPLPVVSAHEAAGDLWLQVHAYEEARRAYELAAQRIGRSNRVLLGLARTAVRLGDGAAACGHYGALAARWTSGPELPAEIRESHEALEQPPCAVPGAAAGRR